MEQFRKEHIQLPSDWYIKEENGNFKGFVFLFECAVGEQFGIASARPHNPKDTFRDKEGEQSIRGGKGLVLAHIEQYRAPKNQLSFTVGSVGRVKKTRHM